jgi:hypothetical protein
MRYYTFFLLFIFGGIATLTAQSTLAKGFDDPPLEARPRGLWDWLNGNVNLSQITLELEEAKKKGMGGFDIWDVGMLVDPDGVVPAGSAFLSDPSVQAIAHAVREAERLDMELGLIISSSWNAGGHWIPAKYGAMGLFRTDVLLKGGTSIDQTLPFPKLQQRDKRDRHPMLHDLDSLTGLPKYYKEVAVLAFPVRPDSSLRTEDILDLSDRMDESGQLNWVSPKGEDWIVRRYVCVPTGQPLSIPSTNSMGRMLDHFSKEAMEFNLSYIIDRLLQELGTLENRALKYLYTDSYEVNSAVWTPKLPEIFMAKNGYDLATFLPILDGYTIDNEDKTERFEYDLKKTLSDLIIENHYKFGRDYCAQYGLGFYAEAGGPGPPIHNVPFEDLKALGTLTVPRGEFWNEHPGQEQLQIVKGIASAAHLYHQPAVEAESFTSVWLWQEGPAELKPLADRAMAEGLNRFIYHTFPHTPPEAGSPGWVYNFGTLIHVNNSWWDKSGGFHEYLARCSYLLQQGHFVGDVLFYYGDRAPNFVNDLTKTKELPAGYDFDVVNTDILLNRMEYKNGRFILPHGQSYRLLVLPDEARIRPELLEKLETWTKAGAPIVGSVPTKTYSLKNENVTITKRSKKLAQQIQTVPLTIALQNANIQPDIQSDNLDQLRYIHRRTATADIYFVVNTSDADLPTSISLRTNDKVPELWHPTSGERKEEVTFKIENDRTQIPLQLAPYESIFILLEKPIEEQKENVMPVLKRVDKQVVEGKWELRFPHGWDAPPTYTIDTLRSWTTVSDPNIQHFSGVATYYKTVEVNADLLKESKRVLLDLGEVREIAEVYLNGQHMGTSWCLPHQFDVTDAIRTGSNYLVVEVANVLNNRMVGDAKKPAEYRRTKSNITKGPNAWMQPWAEVDLVPSGLLGEVELFFYR